MLLLFITSRRNHFWKDEESIFVRIHAYAAAIYIYIYYYIIAAYRRTFLDQYYARVWIVYIIRM